MLELLGHMRRMSASRDREELASIVIDAARGLFNASSITLYHLSPSSQGFLTAPLAQYDSDGFVSLADEISEEKIIPGGSVQDESILAPEGFAHETFSYGCVSAFTIGPRGGTHGLLEIETELIPDKECCRAYVQFLSCYHNQLLLLDYAELDTLTKLLNRKTFDENFDRFIEIAEKAQKRSDDRREGDDIASRPCWLCVIDIDKFKRINDNFGHLFGDEVLLRVAELMKKNFRTRDKLFRFGGEEFVVLLRHVSPEDAFKIFDRFRAAVEAHEFPQVGQVTCSMGYVDIQAILTPAEILGQADEALYFGKENGRNQVNCYTDLVAQGLIEGPQQAAGNDIQADIDALFG